MRVEPSLLMSSTRLRPLIMTRSARIKFSTISYKMKSKVLEENEQILSFKLDVIEKQRILLNKFADQICKFSDTKVNDSL